MTVKELIEELKKLEDKDLDLYVNVHGREFYISNIAYIDQNEVCFGGSTDFKEDGTWYRFIANKLDKEF